MARPKEIVDRRLAEAAKQELVRIKNARLTIKLQAIVSVTSYPFKTTAEVLGVHPVTVWRWIKKFRAGGVGALQDRPKGHNPTKLSAAHQQEIGGWLETGRDAKGKPVHWTLHRLAVEVHQRFGIQITKTPLWQVVRSLGFRQKVPRPIHAKKDPASQQRFKKTPRSC